MGRQNCSVGDSKIAGGRGAGAMSLILQRVSGVFTLRDKEQAVKPFRNGCRHLPIDRDGFIALPLIEDHRAAVMKG